MYKLIKHRGIHNKEIKENTYEGIKMAFLDEKYMGVEFDVRETKDNEFVIYHNAIYMGKLISDYLSKDLPKFIPKLNDVLKIPTNKIFLIEIKNIKSYNKFINLINNYKNKNIYVMSFSNKTIDKINIKERYYKVGVLNYLFNTTNEYKNLDFVGILYSLLNKSIINTLKNLEVFTYGILEKIDELKYDNIYYIIDD